MPHPQMLFDIEECEQLSSIPNKTTVCITTSQSHINFLMASVVRKLDSCDVVSALACPTVSAAI